MNKQGLSLFCFFLFLTQVLIVVKLCHKYSIRFMDKDSLERFLSQASFEDILKAQIASIFMITTFSLWVLTGVLP